MSFVCSVGCIQAYESVEVAVVDVERHWEGETELSVLNVFGTDEEFSCAILVNEGSVGLRVVQTGDFLYVVEDSRRNSSIVVVDGFSGYVFDMSAYCDYISSADSRRIGTADFSAVYLIYLDCVVRGSQCDCRVANKYIMGFVEQVACSCIFCRCNVSFGKGECFANCVATTCRVLSQYIIHEVAVDDAVLG